MSFFGNLLSKVETFALSLLNMTPKAAPVAAPPTSGTSAGVTQLPDGPSPTDDTVLETDVQHAIDLVNNVKTALASPAATLLVGSLKSIDSNTSSSSLTNVLRAAGKV